MSASPDRVPLPSRTVSRAEVEAAPYRPVHLAQPDTEVERRPDGTLVLRSRLPLSDYPRAATERLVYWAAQAPERTFLAQRNAAGEWERLTYT